LGEFDGDVGTLEVPGVSRTYAYHHFVAARNRFGLNSLTHFSVTH
jgi:hypothetical protein